MGTKLIDHSSVEQIIREMTVDEKARMVIGGAPFHTESIPEYGIPAMSMLDSCNGLNSLEYMGEKVYQKIGNLCRYGLRQQNLQKSCQSSRQETCERRRDDLCLKRSDQRHGAAYIQQGSVQTGQTQIRNI